MWKKGAYVILWRQVLLILYMVFNNNNNDNNDNNNSSLLLMYLEFHFCCIRIYSIPSTKPVVGKFMSDLEDQEGPEGRLHRLVREYTSSVSGRSDGRDRITSATQTSGVRRSAATQTAQDEHWEISLWSCDCITVFVIIFLAFCDLCSFLMILLAYLSEPFTECWAVFVFSSLWICVYWIW